MGTIARAEKTSSNPGSTAFKDGSVPTAAELNTDLNTIYTLANGNIEDANIKAAAGIATSKLSADSGSAGQFWKNAGSGSVPTWSDAGVVVTGNTAGTLLSASATRYCMPLGPATPQTTDSILAGTSMIVPRTGTVKNFYVELSGAAGGTSYAFTIMKNGVASSVVVTLTTALTTASDTSNTASVVAGDELSIRIVPAGTPTARTAAWGFEIV